MNQDFLCAASAFSAPPRLSPEFFHILRHRSRRSIDSFHTCRGALIAPFAVVGAQDPEERYGDETP
jgi:hypothetical protein